MKPFELIGDLTPDENGDLPVFKILWQLVPKVIDPNGAEVKPINFTNIDDYDFIWYNEVNNRLTFDPNLINDTYWKFGAFIRIII